MKASTGTPGTAWRLASGPFLFAGAPPMLTGHVALESTSGEQVKVRSIDCGPGGLGPVRLAARMQAGERRRFDAHVVVDPATAPGLYETTLCCGSQLEPAIMRVHRSDVGTIEPRELRLTGAAGSVVDEVILVSNLGNVSHRVPQLARMFLEERTWWGRTSVEALRKTDAGDKARNYTDQWLDELRTSLVPPAEIRVGADITELLPGQAAELFLQFRTPRELVPDRTYYGAMPFLGGRLALSFGCSASAPGTSQQASSIRASD